MIELSFLPGGAGWRPSRWTVRIGHGDQCIHSTDHGTVDDALVMVRILTDAMTQNGQAAQNDTAWCHCVDAGYPGPHKHETAQNDTEVS